jgi:phosphoglycerate kinase
MTLSCIQDLRIENKKVLVRVDFNVPLNEKGEIRDLTRIKEALPTIQYILKKKGTPILMSHFGRPEGKKNLAYSLERCAPALSKLLNCPVHFIKDPLEEISNMKEGEVYLLENLRFYPGEEKPLLDPSFVKKLAVHGDLYINDAFGASHRNHASITELPTFFPGKSGAGFLLQKEIKALSHLADIRPFHAIIGGAKISSKLAVLEAFLGKADALYIGGAMAFTFLKALGFSIGSSLYEPELIEKAKEIIATCKEKKLPFILPIDVLVESKGSTFVRSVTDIQEEEKGMDIGPKTLAFWESSLKTAGSIFWNGPVGVFEDERFAKGTFGLAKFLSTLSSQRVVGGGDSVAAIEQLDLSDKFSHISTGGGASLEFLESNTLPGIESLSKK